MNETQTKRVFRIFWAWQDEKEEQWLRGMAGLGWHLRGVFLGCYTFVAGESSDTVYRIDYQMLRPKERQEYMGLFRDSGWEHVCSTSNWHYFRIAAGFGALPEIFSDVESRIAKYRRLMTILLVFLPILLFGFRQLATVPYAEKAPWLATFYAATRWAYVVLFALYAYVIFWLMVRIRHLKHRRGK